MTWIDDLKKEWPQHTPLKDLKEWLQRYLEKLEKLEKEWWTEYTHFSTSQYHRETIYYEKDTIEFVVISWMPGQSTSVHGHPIGGCLFQLLQGELQEELYNYDHNYVHNYDHNYEHNHEYNHNHTTYSSSFLILPKKEVHYIDNFIGRHRVQAISPSVSFHVYSPPFSKE